VGKDEKKHADFMNNRYHGSQKKKEKKELFKIRKKNVIRVIFNFSILFEYLLK